MDNEVVDTGENPERQTPEAEADSPEARLPKSGFCIGQYRADYAVQSISAVGGIFTGRDNKNRRVLMKIGRHADADATRVQSLKHESEALKAVSNIPVAGVPSYIDYVESDGYVALVEEFVTGNPLVTPHRGRKFARMRPYEVRRFLDHMLQTLREVHHLGYVHNAIEPANILCRLEDLHQPYTLIDFGKADRRGAAGRYREADDAGAAARGFEPDGHFTYIAPERAGGSLGFYCSDLYSLGVIAIQLLTGAELNELTWNAQGHVVLPLYPSAKDTVLERVLTTMTCRSPLQRYQNVDEVISAIAKQEAGEILDKPVEKPQTVRIALAVVLLIVFIVLASIAWKSAVAEYCHESVDCRSSSTR